MLAEHFIRDFAFSLLIITSTVLETLFARFWLLEFVYEAAGALISSQTFIMTHVHLNGVWPLAQV